MRDWQTALKRTPCPFPSFSIGSEKRGALATGPARDLELLAQGGHLLTILQASKSTTWEANL